ncbi:DUF397 domain-containing protein [Streptomyces sp. NPDC047043]|uniref:DUF397 domain-containing protein n=1 Tax=Streptomyces sp. NPDC047043 TaxID=3154497 RepID=UPI0033FC3B49
MTAPSTHQWFKSSHSGGSGTECVECALADGGIRVRDSKCDGGPVLALSAATWRNFVGALGECASGEHRRR